MDAWQVFSINCALLAIFFALRDIADAIRGDR